MADQVIICDACARGFLVWLPGGVDTDPLWQIGFTDHRDVQFGYQCGGALVIKGREAAIKIADNYEQIGAEEWLRGKRQP